MLEQGPSAIPQNEDMFWILRSVGRDAIHDAQLGRVIDIVNSERVGMSEYLESPERAPSALQNGEMIHGRRVNNVVELFQREDGSTTPGLRVQLEEKGLKVSSIPLPVPVRHFGDCASAAASEAASTDPREENFKEALGQVLQKIEKDRGVTIDYAVLAESRPQKGIQEEGVQVVRYREREWLDWREGAIAAERQEKLPTLSFEGVEAPIFAVVEQGELIWCRPIDEEVASYFEQKKGQETCYVDRFYFHDHAAEVKAQERTAKRRRKRQRRRDAAQTSSEDPLAISIQDSEAEAARARKAKKETARKQEQKARKKAKAAAEERELRLTLSSNTENGQILRIRLSKAARSPNIGSGESSGGRDRDQYNGHGTLYAAGEALDINDLETDEQKALARRQRQVRLEKNLGESEVTDQVDVADGTETQTDGSGLNNSHESALIRLMTDAASTVVETAEGLIVEAPEELVWRFFAERSKGRE